MIQNRERETIIVYSKEIFKQNEQKMIKEENLKRVPPPLGWGGEGGYPIGRENI